jgi:seryl-tRNA synthetase
MYVGAAERKRRQREKLKKLAQPEDERTDLEMKADDLLFRLNNTPEEEIAKNKMNSQEKSLLHL